jgi:hypothetical protein
MLDAPLTAHDDPTTPASAPFHHGTKPDLRPGDRIAPGQRPDFGSGPG